MQIKRVGLLTGGGDAPALNAVIRGAVVRLASEGVLTVGILEGWRGMLERNSRELSVDDVAGIIAEGGTILGSSRTNPCKNPERDLGRIAESYRALGLDALIVVGGDDTLGVAAMLGRDGRLNVVGVPKTIDNDLSSTDFSFGFFSAVEVATRAMDDLVSTAKSHRRVLVVECMGRHAGWIAGYAGLAAGADYVLIPEEPIDVEALCRSLAAARRRGRPYNIVAVAEGARLGDEHIAQNAEQDDFGHVRLGGVGEMLAKIIAKKTGFESRHLVLGHLQRAGAPTALDRVLGTRYGVFAAELVLAGKFGSMAALRGGELEATSLSEVADRTKPLSDDFRKLMRLFFPQ
jgi:phosphofructokinase-like protein